MKRFSQIVAGIVCGGLLMVQGAAVDAQDSEMTQLLVQSIYCADNTGFASGDCTPASGVTATASLDGGAVLGTCVTEAGMIRDANVGYCYIEVPYNVDVLVTQDDATLSQGYVSTNNPQQVVVRGSTDSTPDYIPTALFINALAAPAPEAPPAAPAPPEEPARPVTNLPQTGAGPREDVTFLSLMVATAALGIAGLGMALRRFGSASR